ncbi:MAG: hypothetical protein JSW14_06455 [Candidatus Bathyarchaeum sp.]|nr:MAG: hypothetical protein JSW14_06455 [Candidatus Bathyarchaeum sp.]
MLIIVLVAAVFIGYIFLALDPLQEEMSELLVGVDVAYDNMEEIKALVDEISNYTNTLVVGSTGITHNLTKLNEICKYVYDRDMYFMTYMHPDPEQLDEQRQWVEEARTRWGQRFLGLYTFDEPGGRQLDDAQYKVFYETPTNYTDATDKYVSELNNILLHIRESPINAGSLPLFTSDYAFYWFDYKGGYDVVFAEFGWNYSRQLNVALCRGAATAQNKEWGVMITWTYNHPPYLESGPKLYDDLVLAYNNGAKYILVFDTNEDYTHGVLKEEHLEALKQFWNYTENNPRKNEASSERVAYVLPKDFAYGFRGPNDKIWGFWEANQLSYDISVNLGKALEDYETKLDIIYEDGLKSIDSTEYSKLIFWNGTTYEP